MYKVLPNLSAMVGSERDRSEMSSLAHKKIHQKSVAAKKEEILAAVQFCKDNNCRGYKALSTGDFPLIKSHNTINNHLDGKVPPPNQCEDYCKVISFEEEELLVETMINKNRACQSFNRKDATRFMISMLKIRRTINQKVKSGRRYKVLSPASKRLLEKGDSVVLPKLRHFWERFDSKHLKRIKKKRRGSKSLKRVTACSEVVAKQHIDDLAEELILRGVMTDAKKIRSGSWTGKIDPRRVINNDETPQFIDYGTSGHANNIYYAGSGEGCSRASSENRECVTVHPTINLNGEVVSCHVIFAGSGISSNMAPVSAVESIQNLLISVTEHGSQTGKSLLRFYQELDKTLTSNKITRPVVVMTDGHSSRFDLEVLRFCDEKQIFQFLSPPDTTGLLQPLDQINSMLHTAYNESKEKICYGEHINRETFMTMLGEIWPTWVGTESVIKCFKRCGVTCDQLDTSFMQQDKFATAAALAKEPDLEEPSTRLQVRQPWEGDSPAGVKKGSKEYWRRKCLSGHDNAEAHLKVPITIEEFDEITKIEKVHVKKTKNKKVTNMFASLAGQKILEIRERQDKEEKAKKEKMDEKKLNKVLMKERFLVCKDECKCEDECAARGLKQCPVCETVLKSQCNKAQCKLVAGKPVMRVTAADKRSKGKRKAVKKSAKRRVVYSDVYSDSDDSDDCDSNSDESD